MNGFLKIFIIILLIIDSSYTLAKTKSGEKEKQNHLKRLIKKDYAGIRLITPREKKKSVSRKANHPDEGREYLSKAWKEYSKGRYEKASILFTKASKYKSVNLEAEFGLAYCYIKQNKFKKAIPIFEKLVKRRFRLNETIPELIDLLLHEEEYEKANLYLARLNLKDKRKWEKRVRIGLLNRRFKKAEKTKNIKLLKKITKEYDKELKKCSAPIVFYNIAQLLAQGRAKKEAVSIYHGLLSACLNKWDLRLGIFYELKSILKFPEIEIMIENELTRSGLSLDYREKIIRLKTDILKERLAKISPFSPEAERIAEQILSINPEDSVAFSSIAWWYYRKKEYKKSYPIFLKLYQKYPENKDYTLGLIYNLMGFGREDDALRMVKRSGISKEEKRKIEREIYLNKANRAYELRNYIRAKEYLRKVLAPDPGNIKAKELLMWCLYNQGELELALPLFLGYFERQKSSDIAEVILDIYEKLKRRKEAINFAKKIGTLSIPSLNEISANYLFKQEMPVTAAQIYHDPKNFYHNADKPWINLSILYKHKSGTLGFSKLKRVILPFTIFYPIHSGNKLRFSLFTERLLAGFSPNAPFAGNYYKYLSGGSKRHDLITSLWVTSPQVGLEKEGYISYVIRLGTTPLNGPISPIPTILAQAEGRGFHLNWRLNIHQYPVEESILSYVGLRDPYSDRKWGRVLKSGIESEFIFKLFPYRISFNMGYDYYWGRNVLKNHKVQGEMAAERRFSENIGDISVGLFFKGEYFQNNSDFFTFGHGGYFSPQRLFMVGPTIHFETKPYKSSFIDTRVAIGYLDFHTKSASYYPLNNERISSKLFGKYEGEDFSGFGYNIQLQGFKLITPNLATGILFSIDKSSDYTEWLSGLVLYYFLDSRFKLLPKKILLR
jgi:Tfp pilus assembly protein PilF